MPLCGPPIENYNGTWIVYGLGNTVTVSAPASHRRRWRDRPHPVRRPQGRGRGMARRAASTGSTANMRQGSYQSSQSPATIPTAHAGPIAQDAQVRQRIWNVIYSMGADQNIMKEWNITDENRS